MKKEQLFEAIGGAEEELLARSEKKRKKRNRWIGGGVLAACLCLAAAGMLWNKTEGGNGGGSIYAAAISQAAYPEMAPYPNEMDFIDEKTGEFDDEGFSAVYDKWREGKLAQLDQPEGYADNLIPFTARTTQQFLSGADGQNRVYSPVNLYMALSMLAETTDGESREEILNLLGVNDMAALRTKASAIWNANYCRDGAVTSILANSLWLNQNLSYKQSTMDTLAKTYYASSFQGEMGSDFLNQELQNWLNEQTGGLLKEQASQIELEPETVLALASTIYFQAKWSSEFSESNTENGVFHGPDGDQNCDFMRQSSSGAYYWGEHFSAVPKRLEESGRMWLILPDDGVSAEDLLSDDEVMKLLSSGDEWTNRKNLMIHLSMPKFDVSSDLSLVEGLKALGIQDVFDPGAADFSPMTEDADGIYVSQAKHAARVMVDEKGCTAAAYTVMAMAGGAMPPDDEVDFVLDRPFLFVITSEAGAPLFIGLVNQPV